MLAGGLVGCSAAMLFDQHRPAMVEDYPAVHVRLYRIDLSLCRVEIITTTATIVTGMTRCSVLAHRPTP